MYTDISIWGRPGIKNTLSFKSGESPPMRNNSNSMTLTFRETDGSYMQGQTQLSLYCLNDADADLIWSIGRMSEAERKELLFDARKILESRELADG